MSPRGQMRASVLHEYGELARVEYVPLPTLRPGHVLVRVQASGVNPIDTKIRVGGAGHAQTTLPTILGIDLAGIVEAVAGDVTDFTPGDEVYGMTGGVGGVPGSLAEYAAVDAHLLALKPKTWTFKQAAAAPLSIVTAWEGLVDRAHVAIGDTVLIQGGAGGVGHIAIQLAVSRGAVVFATGSPKDAGLISELGATPIDYTSTSSEEYVEAHTNGEGFDIIFDGVGGATLDASFAAVRRYTGHVVSALGWGSHSLAPLSFRGATYSGIFTLMPLITGNSRAHHGSILRRAATLADASMISPIVDPREFTLDTVHHAHKAVETKANRGKVVIAVANGTLDA